MAVYIFYRAVFVTFYEARYSISIFLVWALIYKISLFQMIFNCHLLHAEVSPIKHRSNSQKQSLIFDIWTGQKTRIDHKLCSVTGKWCDLHQEGKACKCMLNKRSLQFIPQYCFPWCQMHSLLCQIQHNPIKITTYTFDINLGVFFGVSLFQQITSIDLTLIFLNRFASLSLSLRTRLLVPS